MLTADDKGFIDQYSDSISQFMNCQCSHDDYFNEEESSQITIDLEFTPSPTTSPSFLALVDDQRLSNSSAAFSDLVTTMLHSLSKLQLQLDKAIHQIHTNEHNLKSENKRLKQKLTDTMQQQKKSQQPQPNHKVVNVATVDTCIQPPDKPTHHPILELHSKKHSSASASSTSSLQKLEKQNTELQKQVFETKHELEAAIREAATQRRRANNQQQENDDHHQYAHNNNSYQTNCRQLNILRNRIRVLEAHNIKLRVANKALEEEKMKLEGSNNNNNKKNCKSTTSSGEAGSTAIDDASQKEVEDEESNTTNSNTIVAIQKWEAERKLKDQLEASRSKLRASATCLSSSEASNTLLKGQVERLERESVSKEGRIKHLTHRIKQAESARNSGSISVDTLKKMFDDLDCLQQDKRNLERKVLELTSSAVYQHNDSTKNVHHQEYEPRRYSDEDCTVIVHNIDTIVSQPNADSQWLRASNFETTNAPQPLSLDSTKKKMNDSSKGSKQASNNYDSDVDLMKLEKQQALEETCRIKSYLNTLLSILASAFSHNSSSICWRQSPGTFIPKRYDGIQKAIEKLKLEVERVNNQGGGKDSLTVSSTKYMQVVNKCRALQTQIDHLTAELNRKHLESDKLQEYKQRMIKLAAALGELRSRNMGAAAKRQCETTALLTAREEIMNAQVAELERALAERDAQLSYLYQGGAVSQLQTLLREGLRPRDLVEELMSARQQVKELRKEMEDKRRKERGVREAAGGVDDTDTHTAPAPAMSSDDDDS